MKVYCLGCREKTDTKGGHAVVCAGRDAYAGTCSACGCRKQVFVKSRRGGSIDMDLLRKQGLELRQELAHSGRRQEVLDLFNTKWRTAPPGVVDYGAWFRKQPDVRAALGSAERETAGLKTTAEATTKKNLEAHDEEMRRRHGPAWDRYSAETKKALALAPLQERLKESIAKRNPLLRHLITTDPIIVNGLEQVYEFLVNGGTEVAKAVLTGKPQDALVAIAKKAAPGLIGALTASREDPGPIASKLREVAKQVAGSGMGRGAPDGPTTDTQISARLAGLQGFLGCFPVDQMPRLRRGQCLIANADTSDGPGTHWIAISAQKGTPCIFDPFGCPPDPRMSALLSRFKGKHCSNTLQYQPPESQACGPLAAYFLDRRAVHDLYTVLYDDLSPSTSEENCRKAREWFGSHGSGVISELHRFFTGVYPGQKDCEATVQAHADAIITEIRVVRAPINSVYRTLVKVVSLGAFDRELEKKNISDVYHLAMNVKLSDGWSGRMEKNERVKIGPPLLEPGSQSMPVSLSGKRIKFSDFWTQCMGRIGERRFWSYSASDNNCQRWISDLLSTQGLLTQTLDGWINQPVADAAKTLPGITKHLLDLASVVGRPGGGEDADMETEGGGGLFLFGEPKTNMRTKTKALAPAQLQALSTLRGNAIPEGRPGGVSVGGSMKKAQGYCMKCRATRTMMPKERVTKNKMVMATGKCDHCGTTICKFVRKA